MADYLQQEMLKPMAQLQTDPMFFDAIAITLIQATMNSTVALPTWYLDYYMRRPESKRSRELLAQEVRHGDARRRPIVVCCQRRWWVWYKKRMVPCGHSLVHAVLSWLWIMQRDFQGLTSETKVVSPVFRLLLNQDSLAKADPLARMDEGWDEDFCHGLEGVDDL